MNTFKIKHIISCLNLFDFLIIWFKTHCYAQNGFILSFSCCCLATTCVANQEIDINDIGFLFASGTVINHQKSPISCPSNYPAPFTYPTLIQKCVNKKLFRVHGRFRGHIQISIASYLTIIKSQNFQHKCTFYVPTFNISNKT